MATPSIGRLIAEARGDAARPGDEVLGHRSIRIRGGKSHVDAPGQAAPGIGPGDLPRADLHVLIGPPMLQRALDDGTAPGERRQHPAFRARQHRHRARDVLALDDEPAPGVVGRFDRSFERRVDGVVPAGGIEADGVGDAPVGPRAEALERRVELFELRRHSLRGRQRGLVVACHELSQPLQPPAASVPLVATLRKAL
jgi:hypothetical protein